MINFEMKRIKVGMIVKSIFVVIAMSLLMIISLQPYAMNRLKEKCTESVIGTCVEVTSVQKDRIVKKTNHKGHHKNKITRSYVEYKSHIVYIVNGKEYETTKVNKNSPNPKEGEQIEIFYDPNAPETCYIP